MVAKAVRTHGQLSCTIEVAPSEVDAGAALTVAVRAACRHGCDLAGQRVSIRDGHGTELASAELTELDGEAYVTTAISLQAPLTVGEHVCRAVLAAHKRDGVLHEETSAEFSVLAMAHAASM